LKKINTEILKKHLETCVKESRESEDFDTKIKELEEVIEYVTKAKGE
jgi:DNA-binding FrmR family transcriptional regulator